MPGQPTNNELEKASIMSYNIHAAAVWSTGALTPLSPISSPASPALRSTSDDPAAVPGPDPGDPAAASEGVFHAISNLKGTFRTWTTAQPSRHSAKTMTSPHNIRFSPSIRSTRPAICPASTAAWSIGWGHTSPPRTLCLIRTGRTADRTRTARTRRAGRTRHTSIIRHTLTIRHTSTFRRTSTEEGRVEIPC